jgi:hypothetical protein
MTNVPDSGKDGRRTLDGQDLKWYLPDDDYSDYIKWERSVRILLSRRFNPDMVFE